MREAMKSWEWPGDEARVSDSKRSCGGIRYVYVVCHCACWFFATIMIVHCTSVHIYHDMYIIIPVCDIYSGIYLDVYRYQVRLWLGRAPLV